MSANGEKKCCKKKKKDEGWEVVTKQKGGKGCQSQGGKTKAVPLAAPLPMVEAPIPYLSQDLWEPNAVVAYSDGSTLAAPLSSSTKLAITPRPEDVKKLAPVRDASFGRGIEGLMQTTMDRVLAANTILLRFAIHATPEELRKDSRRLAATLLTSDVFAKAAVAQLSERFEGRWRASHGPSSSVVCLGSLSAQQYVRYLTCMLVRGHPEIGFGKTVESAQIEVSRFLSGSYKRSPEIKPLTRTAPAQLQAQFTMLDKEILRYMFGFLTPSALAIARRVCVAWNRVGGDNRLWIVLHRRFPDVRARMCIPARAKFYAMAPANAIVPVVHTEGFAFFKGKIDYEHVLLGVHQSTAQVIITNGWA